MSISKVTYEEYLPAREIRDYVKCFWILDSNGQSVNIENKLSPSGCVDILFQQTPCLFCNFEFTGLQIQLPQFLVAIQFSRAFDIKLIGNVKIFGIRLQPFAGKSVLGIPFPEISNSIMEVKDILGQYYQIFADSLINADTNQHAIDLMNSFFSIRCKSFSALDYIVKDLCNAIISCHTLPVQEIYDRYKETKQVLRTRFYKEVGLHPKNFADIAHVSKVLSYQSLNDYDLNLTDLAITTGHFDQSHFIKKFKSIMNICPGEYFKAKNLINSFFNKNTNISSLLHIELESPNPLK